jgi:hypothetical protein
LASPRAIFSELRDQKEREKERGREREKGAEEEYKRANEVHASSIRSNTDAEREKRGKREREGGTAYSSFTLIV